MTRNKKVLHLNYLISYKIEKISLYVHYNNVKNSYGIVHIGSQLIYDYLLSVLYYRFGMLRICYLTKRQFFAIKSTKNL